MKSTLRLDKIVDKIWNQSNHESTALNNSSADDFPIQPPIRQIEVVYLDKTTSKNNKNSYWGTNRGYPCWPSGRTYDGTNWGHSPT